jgi:hypothetical protein
MTKTRNLALLSKETNRISAFGKTSRAKSAWCVVTIDEMVTRSFELT